MKRLGVGTEMDRRFWAHQKLYLHRRSPLASSFWTLRDHGGAPVVPGRLADHAGVLEIVERFEGAASAAIAERWLEAQPENLMVTHSGGGVAGFAFQVIYPADPSLCDADPVVRAVLAAAARMSPARPGEQICISRFLAGAADYQRDAHAVVTGSVASTIEWVSRPLAWSFAVTTDPEYWRPRFAYLALDTELTVEGPGGDHTVFGIDWRRLPVKP